MDEASGGETRPKWWSRSRRQAEPAGPDGDQAASEGRDQAAHDSGRGEASPEDEVPGEIAARPIESTEAEKNAERAGATPSDAPGAAGERRVEQTPLHPEDPYGTPPYGGPGPWALAPPVQHPRSVNTPAHGTGVPPTYGTPTHGTPTHGASTSGTPGTPASGTPVPANPAPGTPAHGTGVPPAGQAGAAQQWQGYDPWATSAGAAPGGACDSGGTPSRPGLSRGAILVGAVVVALLAGGVGGAVGMYVERHGALNGVSLSQAPVEGPDRPADSVAGIASATLPGVVTLHARGASGQSTGTGFVLDDRGHILTNHHVVSSAEQGGRISVTFHGGETVRARLVGGDGGYDLAVVKVDRVSGLKPLPLGNSESVQVGDSVVAIGSPFDLAGTVTTGIISAKERPITAGGRGDSSDVSYVNALQTDAPINPGNSGGPLVDTKGRVIGVNSAIRSGEGEGGGPGDQGSGSVGLGFAIPINQAKRVAEELISTGRATHPVIGVSVDMSRQGEDGARVSGGGSDQPGVVPDGPADDAGIEEGDVITAIDGDRVRNGEELIVKIRSHEPGDVLELTVRRDEEETEVKVTLGTGRSG